MTASDNKFVQTTQKSLFPGFQLLSISTFTAVGLLSAQAALAQTDAGVTELVIPDETPVVQPATPAPIETPVVQPAAPAPTVPPLVIEPVVPNGIVPQSIETTSAEPTDVDYGTIFTETVEPAKPAVELPSEISQPLQPTNEELPTVEVISPFDYGTAEVDTTDYSIGATMPDVIVSERSSGCEFSLQAGDVASATCRQVERLATAITGGGIAPAPVHSPGPINLPRFTGATTAASREYYNRAAEPVVKLQLGEKFIFPLSVPASLTSLFGWRIHPIFGDYRFHSGSDLGAPMGTPVVATQAGRVTLSDFLGGYGLMVILRHNDDSLESRYAHLSRLLVQAGDWVEQGEVVGLVGNTGNSTGPHLHFELRQRTDNGWVVLNPDGLLQKTLGTLTKVLGNSVLAFAGKSIETPVGEPPSQALQNLPFRPAQPHAN